MRRYEIHCWQRTLDTDTSPRQTLNSDTKKAQDLVDGFKDLAKDINAFKATWEGVIRRHKLDLKTATIKSLDKEISLVINKLKAYVIGSAFVLTQYWRNVRDMDQ